MSGLTTTVVPTQEGDPFNFQDLNVTVVDSMGQPHCVVARFTHDAPHQWSCLLLTSEEGALIIEPGTAHALEFGDDGALLDVTPTDGAKDYTVGSYSLTWPYASAAGGYATATVDLMPGLESSSDASTGVIEDPAALESQLSVWKSDGVAKPGLTMTPCQ